MATANPRMVSKTRQKTVEEVYTELDGVTLVLDNEEAALLSAILYTRVTGSGPLRITSDRICNALTSSGFGSHENAGTRAAIAGLEGYVNLKRVKEAF